MAFNLRNRSFLTLADFNTREMEYMLNLAEDLKKAKYAGYEGKNLEGKNIALIFEKSSTRTRCDQCENLMGQGKLHEHLHP